LTATTTNSRLRNRSGGVSRSAAQRMRQVVDSRRHASTVTMPHEGELNVQFSRSRPVVKEGTRSVDQGTSRNWCRARSLWQVIRKGRTHQKAFRISSGTDRGCPKKALGEGSENGEGCSDTCQTHALRSGTKEDRCGTEGSMGKGEGAKEDSLELDFANQASLSQVEVDSPVRAVSPSSESNGATNRRAAISFLTRSIPTSFCLRSS